MEQHDQRGAIPLVRPTLLIVVPLFLVYLKRSNLRTTVCQSRHEPRMIFCGKLSPHIFLTKKLMKKTVSSGNPGTFIMLLAHRA